MRPLASAAFEMASFGAPRTNALRTRSRYHPQKTARRSQTSQSLDNFLVSSTIRTSAAILFMAFAIVLVLPFLILWSAMTRSADLMYSLSMTSVRIIARIVGIRVRVEGIENIPPGVCIFASNHVSNVDPIALFPAVPRRLSVIAKKELFRIPILSFGMRQAGFIPLDRSNRKASAASVDTAIRELKSGLSFAVFPEGTRSLDGRLGPFKKGAFLMAIQAGVPVVPVSLLGTQNLLRKGHWSVQPGDVTVRFGAPVDASLYRIDQRGELLARVEALVADGLPPDQRPLPRAPHPANPGAAQ
jgi:1-acyl-sn-glycerol-3-phosphate acyltransferase